MKKLFGTDGIRGLAGAFPLDEKTVFTIGWSLARIFENKIFRDPWFVTGRDTRESGGWIERALHAGVRSQNAVCHSAGVITTPGVAFLTRFLNYQAGIVISASHNPFEDNGIKIFLPTGEKISEDTEAAIEENIFEDAAKEAFEIDEEELFDDFKASEFQEKYLYYLTQNALHLTRAGGYPDRCFPNIKMVVDCANGAASALAPEFFSRMGAEVVAIDNAPDGRNINKDCGSLHLEHLQAKVVEEKADFGVAFDGDADRALFVDEKGNLVDGDATLWILAQYLDSHGKLNNSTVVATVMSNLGLELALKSKNIRLVRTAVGDKYVLEGLMETRSSIGGEQSGHILLPDTSLVGDGIMTTVSLLAAMKEKDRKLSEMTSGFIRYPQVLVNVKVGKKLPFEEVREISEASKQLENELDGKGRLLLRYSGTENLARVMIEGTDQAEIEKQALALADVIKTSLS